MREEMGWVGGGDGLGGGGRSRRPLQVFYI